MSKFSIKKILMFTLIALVSTACFGAIKYTPGVVEKISSQAIELFFKGDSTSKAIDVILPSTPDEWEGNTDSSSPTLQYDGTDRGLKYVKD
ncbi:MAG: hypothetical protein IJA72_02685, partial [Clostridia bacterium]|nr:hypothetical protein [Clostridia bacterium]